MGNQPPKKKTKLNKGQIDIACMKTKIHLELMRDRKNAEIIKGEKQLMRKIKSNSRNKTQQVLLMEKIVNGLKYSQATNQLMAYAASLKGQSSYIVQNVGNRQKLEPWLTPIYSLLYAADHLGVSSLNEFKSVMKGLNDPTIMMNYVNPEIIELLKPTPTPYQLNIYAVQMSQRNQITLEQINIVGHRFKSDPDPDLSESRKTFQDIEKQLAQEFKKNLGGDGFGGNNQGGGSFGGHQGGMGGYGGGNQGMGGFGGNNQGGGSFGGHQGGFGGNQGGMGGYGGNQGGMGGYGGGNQGGMGVNQGGFNGNNGMGGGDKGYYDNSNKSQYSSNPYKGLSNINDGPNYYSPSNLPSNQHNEAPKKFGTFDSVIGKDDDKVNPIYPSVNPDSYQPGSYQPSSSGNNQNPGDNQNGQSNKGSSGPTISQIMRQFDVK